MKLVTSPMVSLYGGSETEIPAGTRMIMPDWAAMSLAQALREYHEHPRISGLGHYLKPYHGQDLNGKRLLAWRGLGIGDQLVFAGLLSILAWRFPLATIDFLVHPAMYAELWEGANTRFGILQEPLNFDDFRAYDFHLLGENLCEVDKEPDQPDIWTGHLQFAGIDPATVPDSQRVPIAPIRFDDRVAAARWIHDQGYSTTDKVIVWQLAASTPARSYRPDLTEEALGLLADRFPRALIAVTGCSSHYKEYPLPMAPNIRTTHSLTFREIMALCNLASCVVCPDSSLGHVCAAVDRPCVSLWSSFLPTDRVGSYTSHRPLVGDIECSPCRHHEKGHAQPGCPKIGEDPHACKYCAGLANIAPETIVQTVREIMT